MSLKIIQAFQQHVPDLIPLFDAYRIFYRQKSDYSGARKFLNDRLQNNEAIIYLAYEDENAVGFTQLFPIFSSVSMEPMYLLNDLYVEKNYRAKGIGKALIDKAKELCIDKGYKGLALQTEADNPAQRIYEYLGFERDADLFYFWTNNQRKAR
ncbi:MAG: GNAT family N-acetyltransferase [Bacteroidia bacterium]|nr:GNAT family N-acetyltransferase [Bacteroidia bacterium]MBT8267634.1 GNAT family N-acetyltransferase [Bacteroidia bacterium]NNF81170.1 GNAT family N-acetyltransferase [Flavobacteriaceae bacterium]NNK71503.1 GNAT family N-acetyltransferase [Flavobacteriaceae bacterium]NNL81022.1 GNAT family N-acetyltransferase [Flavobacteriaceae bacterium]